MSTYVNFMNFQCARLPVENCQIGGAVAAFSWASLISITIFFSRNRNCSHFAVMQPEIVRRPLFIITNDTKHKCRCMLRNPHGITSRKKSFISSKFQVMGYYTHVSQCKNHFFLFKHAKQYKTGFSRNLDIFDRLLYLCIYVRKRIIHG